MAKIGVIGEIVNNIFVPGINKKPSFKSKVRLIVLDELYPTIATESLSELGLAVGRYVEKDS